MTVIGRIVACLVVATAVALPAARVRAADMQLSPTIHHRMSRYVDAKYHFSFWYPAALRITVTAANDDASFPGGVVVETLQVRPAGGISLYVVNSPQSTITDEPNGHAAPIPQTKYFYDAASQRWMVAYPEGTDGGGSGAPAPADVSKTTIGGQPMLPSGARFDTTIIPLVDDAIRRRPGRRRQRVHQRACAHRCGVGRAGRSRGAFGRAARRGPWL